VTYPVQIKDEWIGTRHPRPRSLFFAASAPGLSRQAVTRIQINFNLE
jgi:hypothetical protein